MRIPWLSVVIGILVVLATDLYIFFDIRRYSSARTRRIYLWCYAVLSVLCWALLVVALALPKRDVAVSLLPQIWMLYTFISIYAAKIFYCLCSAMGRFLFRAKSRMTAYISLAVAAAVFIFMWWGAIFTRNEVRTNNVEITSEKLPASFDGYKVLQFSDLHVGTWGNDTTFVSRLVDSINAKNADLVLFTGDIVNRYSGELDPFVPVLKRIKARDGVYAVFGNHDYAGYANWTEPGYVNKDVRRLDSLITNGLGWRMLNNSSVFIGNGVDSLALIGVENWGEPPFNRRGNLAAAYPSDSVSGRSLNDDRFKILMTHNPEHWGQIVRNVSNIDLSLAGHTHAMQMMFGAGKHVWSPSAWRYKYWGGLYGDTTKNGEPLHLYVNIGAGEVGFPARLGAAVPELTLFILKPAHK